MLNARHEIPNASEALPECFDAEARSDLRPREPPSMAIWRITSQIEGGSVGGFFLRENIGSLPFGLCKQGARGQVWVGATQAHQSRQAPGHHHIHDQRQFKLGDVAQLQCLNTATVFEDV